MMQTREDEDFKPILWILHSTESAHKLHYAAGVCTLGIEYYRNGNKRLYYRHPVIASKSIFKEKLIEGESWSWSGKSIAKVVNGNGTQISLPYDFEDPKEEKSGFYEEFSIRSQRSLYSRSNGYCQCARVGMGGEIPPTRAGPGATRALAVRL